jgi:hypothetical protein
MLLVCARVIVVVMKYTKYIFFFLLCGIYSVHSNINHKRITPDTKHGIKVSFEKSKSITKVNLIFKPNKNYWKTTVFTNDKNHTDKDILHKVDKNGNYLINISIKNSDIKKLEIWIRYGHERKEFVYVIKTNDFLKELN